MSRGRKFSEDYPEVLREGADDVTLRAEELDTLKGCINVEQFEETDGDRHWWMQFGTLSCKQFTKELKRRVVLSLQRGEQG